MGNPNTKASEGDVPITMENEVIKGFILVRATEEHPTGLVRIYNDNDKHVSISCVYFFLDREIKINTDVFIEVALKNGISVATKIWTDKPPEFHLKEDFKIEDFTFNIHNGMLHPQEPIHVWGHVMRIVSDTTIYGVKYYQSIFYDESTDSEKEFYFSYKPDINGDKYFVMPEFKYEYVESLNKTRIIMKPDGVPIQFVTGFSTEEHHFGDPRKVLKQ